MYRRISADHRYHGVQMEVDLEHPNTPTLTYVKPDVLFHRLLGIPMRIEGTIYPLIRTNYLEVKWRLGRKRITTAKDQAFRWYNLLAIERPFGDHFVPMFIYHDRGETTRWRAKKFIDIKKTPTAWRRNNLV